MIRAVGDRTVVTGRGGGITYLCPVSVDWQSPDCKSQILMVLSSLPLAIWFPSGLHATDQTLKLREVITRINRSRERNTWKKLTGPSGLSASTGNLQIVSPKSWWYCPRCRWQFAFHRDSTPLNRPWNCKKSAHKSTQTERKKLKKTYISECPVTGHSQKCILKSLTFTSFSSMYLSTTSCIFECSISRALQTGT